MRTRLVQRAGLKVSEIGFGAAMLGNLYHPMSDGEAHDALTAALDAGMTYIDTAPRYGHGLSERRVGDVVRARADVILSSKVGRLFRANPKLKGDGERNGFRSPLPFESAYDYSYGGIMRSYEDSLQRLGLARIDILYVHDVGRLTHGHDHARTFAELTGGGFRALEELRAAGAIAGFGLGVNEWEICMEVMDHAALDMVLLAGRYTLLEQGALAHFLPACVERGISVVIGGAYNSGILATGTRGGEPPLYDYAPAPPQVIEHVRRLEAICDAFAVPLAAAALQFPLAHPAIASVIPGLGSVARVNDTMTLYDTAIPQAFWVRLRETALVPPDAPLPGEA
ncbi:MAG TPA: aldo/keto reductase [Rhizomicrobium sp.]|jgi:D-threo-aldose 1-dehydrogenase|nr:aldo/keto reductase [Rhizomicrobium sp.]